MMLVSAGVMTGQFPSEIWRGGQMQMTRLEVDGTRDASGSAKESDRPGIVVPGNDDRESV